MSIGLSFFWLFLSSVDILYSFFFCASPFIALNLRRLRAVTRRCDMMSSMSLLHSTRDAHFSANRQIHNHWKVYETISCAHLKRNGVETYNGASCAIPSSSTSSDIIIYTYFVRCIHLCCCALSHRPQFRVLSLFYSVSAVIAVRRWCACREQNADKNAGYGVCSVENSLFLFVHK